jgi:hypothetical protein
VTRLRATINDNDCRSGERSHLSTRRPRTARKRIPFPQPDVFFVNIRFLFTGDRLAFVTPPLQMRCISGGADRHSVSANGNGSDAAKSENPCVCKGFGIDRRQSASIVKAEGMGFEPTTPCGASDFES